MSERFTPRSLRLARQVKKSGITCDIMKSVSNAQKLLAPMRRNPRDWRIDRLCVVAAASGLTVRQGKGSHVVFSHASSPMMVTIPARRPVKPPYVKQLLTLIDEVTQQ